MTEYQENPKCLQPFFGVPKHNNKLLQVIYPFASILVIAYTSWLILNKEKVKNSLEVLHKFLTEISTKSPRFVHIASKTMIPVIFLLLSFTSFCRTIISFDDKLKHTSRYSKVNDGLYWLGGVSVVASSGISLYSWIADVNLPVCNIFGAEFAVQEIVLCVAALLLLFALLMSIASTIVPSLTAPSTKVSNTTRDSSASSLDSAQK